ncbi:MAG TPA: HAMP domain-containing sensor histidine kinase [Cyclobacteriaceae bacterium]|jgi:signal transduction histidine kinase|nr:HAMP domain-containing sensor histidine kinase [Cyclobacteriaceae bacterium]
MKYTYIQSYLNYIKLLMLFFHLNCAAAFGQGTQHVLVKTFDQSLKRIPNVELSINGKSFVDVGSKSEKLIELEAQDIPLKSIIIRDEQLEAASWNYSKGVLEVIIRKKSYKMVQVYIQDNTSDALKNVSVTFRGAKTTNTVTDNEGKIEVALALDEKIESKEQFIVTDFQIINLLTSESRSVLTVRKRVSADVPQISKSKRDFPIDSIRSLEEFYRLFKNYQSQILNEETRKKLNDKLKQLMVAFEDSVKGTDVKYMARISDVSPVKEDIKNIISHATIENQQLAQHRKEFNNKIRVINQKLARGVLNIDAETRATLLADITRLEIILENNRSSFYKNQEDYHQILNTIKEKFLNIDDLQNKLSLSETQRQNEQESFKTKMIITLSIASLSALLVILLIYFSSKLRRQKRELIVANAEVKHVNENLEGLVKERTHLLEEANLELDTFLYKASHNLRSPVSSMIGLCNIASQVASAESKELFDRALQTVHAMDRLLLKLKVISEISRSNNFNSFYLSALTSEIRNLFQDKIDEYAISFIVDCPDDLRLYSDRNLIDAILFNLIENAIHYCTINEIAAREIRVAATVDSAFVQLSVYDNGVGIRREIQERIYAMFFVGNEESKGNGLGLYIVQKAVQAIGGSVSVESELDQYTKFTVRIPLGSIDSNPE